MVVFWRGQGLVAPISLLPALLLVGVEPKWIAQVWAIICIAGAGIYCVRLGMSLNRPTVEHSMYFIPIEKLGWLYLLLDGMYSANVMYDSLKNGLKRPGSVAGAIVGGIGISVVITAICYLNRSVASEFESEESATTDVDAMTSADD